MGLGGETSCLRSALNLLAMLVAAGDEQHRFAAEPPLPGDRVTGQGGVGAAEVGAIVDVVEGRGEGEYHPA